MEVLLEKYSIFIILFCVIVLVVAIGGFNQVRTIMSKSLVLIAFITVLFNSKTAIADNGKNIALMHNIKNDVDPWQSQPVEDSTTTTTQTEIIENVPQQVEQIPQQNTHVVVVGENLYSIAKLYTNNISSTDKLWREIIAQNTSNLISKNPNLIYAGEVITIPTINS